MATFKSDITLVQGSAQTVFSKFSNLENLKSLLERIPADQIPDDKREMFDNLEITSDSLTIPAGPVGVLTLRLTEKVEPTLIRLEGENTPVPVSLMLHIMPEGESNCNVQVEIDLAIPAMLKPMVSGPVKKIVDQFAQVMQAIPFN